MAAQAATPTHHLRFGVAVELVAVKLIVVAVDSDPASVTPVDLLRPAARAHVRTHTLSNSGRGACGQAQRAHMSIHSLYTSMGSES